MSYGYRHFYDVTTCPDCNADLTVQGNVALIVVVAGKRFCIQTRLSHKKGELIDVDNVVDNGYYNTAECGDCGCSLDQYENVERRE